MVRIFQPFDPEERVGRRPRQLPQIPVRLLLPNMVTLIALCAGLTAIRMALEGQLEVAVYATLFAAALDGIDGRVARLLRSTSRFGAQLDSLADFVNFGVSPAIILFAWSLGDLGSFGWVGALIFAICAALRLARFNVALDTPNKPAWQGEFFVGVPAPAGAVTVLMPIYLDFQGIPYGSWTAPLVLAYTVLIAMLMISRVPSFSGRLVGRKVQPDLVPLIFIALVVVIAVVVSFPWVVLAVGSLGYLGLLPFSWNAWREYRRRDQLAPAPSGAEAEAARLDQLRLEPPPHGSPRRGKPRKSPQPGRR